MADGDFTLDFWWPPVAERSTLLLPSGESVATVKGSDGVHMLLAAAGGGGGEYRAARTGSIAVPEGALLRRVRAVGDTGGGSVRVQGGDAIPIAAGDKLDVDFGGAFIGVNDNDVVASSTTSLFVSWDPA